jgi:hypothetical protein
MTTRSNRREMGRRMLRYLALTAIAVLSAVLLGRRGGVDAGRRCLPACRGCTALATCNLPRAVALREDDPR